MSNLQPLPPWKKNTPNGYKYKDKGEIPEGYFLEQFCIIAARLNDICEALRDIRDQGINIYDMSKET